jgi:hypothetical protein
MKWNHLALLNTVMNLRVPYVEGSFLTSSATVRCTRWTLLPEVKRDPIEFRTISSQCRPGQQAEHVRLNCARGGNDGVSIRCLLRKANRNTYDRKRSREHERINVAWNRDVWPNTNGSCMVNHEHDLMQMPRHVSSCYCFVFWHSLCVTYNVLRPFACRDFSTLARMLDYCESAHKKLTTKGKERTQRHRER